MMLRARQSERVPEGCAPTMFAELAITLLSIYWYSAPN
jgi:hypothetical protein